MAVKKITADDLRNYIPRFFILDIGHPGSGKSTHIVHIAEADPDSKVYALDTENGIAQLWKSKYQYVKNLVIYLCTDMDSLLDTLEEIMKEIRPQDWLCLESMAKIWELSQDVGYSAVTGMKKSEWLEKRREIGSKAVTPSPSDLWQIVASVHGRGLIDPLIESDPIMASLRGNRGCNVLATTILAKERPERLEARRKKMAAELGVDVLWEGSPRLPSYFDTILLSTNEDTRFYCEVLKDRGYQTPGTKVKFEVNNFWRGFTDNCRKVICPFLNITRDPSMCRQRVFAECQECIWGKEEAEYAEGR